jgi:hypothetical protein
MPANLGMMCNDTLDDCTCAAIYHARQVWTANIGTMITEPDTDVELLYQYACGWNPKEPGEGPGGNEQDVLTFLLKIGAPAGSFGASTNKISAFVEVDPRNIEDVKRTIYACGVAYIGFNVPASLQLMNPPPKVWQVDPGNSRIVGGHAVVLVGYDAKFAKVISWGRYYKMTWQFFLTYVDEVYAIADDAWFTTTDNAQPLGISLPELELQMKWL